MIKLENISFDHCIKCTICTMYCPVSQATHLFPGPKASGPDAERLRIKNPELVDSSLKYCTNCKRCEISCPSDVMIAEVIQSAKWKYMKTRWFRPRDFFMSRTDLVGGLATKLSFFANYIINLAAVRVLMHLFLKIPFRAKFPSYQRGTFVSSFRKKSAEQSLYDKKVTYFHGCYVNYNDHSVGNDFVKVMNSLGYGVEIKKEKCCGVPLIANGYIEKAKKNALFNIASLGKDGADSKILATSSSCTYALKHEYSGFLELDNTSIADRVEFSTRFIYNEFLSGNIPAMRHLGIRAAYHSPCHLERMGGVMHTLGVLKKIPGLELVVLNSECCGIAGTYGFKRENYPISLSVGKNLFSLIDNAVPEIVITDCETCKMQIEMNTRYRVMHPVSVLAMAIEKK